MVRVLGGIGHLDDGGVEWPAAPVSRGVVTVGHRDGLVGGRVPACVSIPARACLKVGVHLQAGAGVPPGAGFLVRIGAPPRGAELQVRELRTPGWEAASSTLVRTSLAAPERRPDTFRVIHVRWGDTDACAGSSYGGRTGARGPDP